MIRTFRVLPWYDISDDDVEQAIAEENGIEVEDVNYDYDLYTAKREEIEDSLPGELFIELDVEDEDDDEIEEMLSDAITDMTGYLHDGYDYEEVYANR